MGPADRSLAGAYGYREGVPRILNLLAKHGISCIFFVPGMIVERNREVVQEVKSDLSLSVIGTLAAEAMPIAVLRSAMTPASIENWPAYRDYKHA